MKKRLIAIVVAAIATAVAGGIAFAATSGDGTVKACAKQANGQLRLDTGGGCLPSETGLAWNQAGPQGIQGPAGVTRADERSFYRGGADVPNWLPIVSGTWPDVRPFLTHVLSMHLDAGNYVVTAEVIAENDAGRGVVVCLLGNPTAGYALAQSAVGMAAGFALQQTFALQSVFKLGSAADLELSCFNALQNEPGGNPKIGLADVIATKVDTFTSTVEP